MSEALKMIGYMFMGSGIVAWVFTIWAVVLVFQKRLSVHIIPRRKE